jgi:hypothetical protein
MRRFKCVGDSSSSSDDAEVQAITECITRTLAPQQQMRHHNMEVEGAEEEEKSSIRSILKT